MASSEFPNNLVTNTYILHDYVEIAYIVCTGAIPVTIDISTNVQDINSRERVLARLKNARQQFRHASILVVLDIEKLELITFYKKADIIKDQQAILAKFGHICKMNACKIERKNACRVRDLTNPDLARVWRLFSEAVLSSLTLQASTWRRVIKIGTNIHLVPEFEVPPKGDPIRSHPEARYHLRKADLQIVNGGHLLLAIRDSGWMPLYPLYEVVRMECIPWRLHLDSILYLLPTGQLARYKGGWIGKQNFTDPNARHFHIYGRDDLGRQSHWFERVKQWLQIRDQHYTIFSRETVWCTVEIPVLEDVNSDRTENESIVWKSVVWPIDLLYVFQDESEPVLQGGIKDVFSDPLLAAQEWYIKDLSDVRAAAASSAAKDTMHSRGEAPLTDRSHFDDDVQFGSPQQFMSVPAQAFHLSQIVYPTPPEAMNPQNTPGVSMDGAVQTPMSAQPLQPLIYQSSPLAMTTDPEAAHPNESAISSFLQHNDEDLFEDEEDQKLAQPSFGNEPDWDFFDRETTALEMKPGMGFEELQVTPLQEKAPDHEQTVQVRILSADHETPGKETFKNELMPSELIEQTQHNPSEKSLSPTKADGFRSPEITNSASHIAQNQTTATTTVRGEAFVPVSTKRRRSSAYDVAPPASVGHDHKYGPSGKYHFDFIKPSAAMKDSVTSISLARRSSSSSLSSMSSNSGNDSDEEGHREEPLKLWAQYDPVHTSNSQDMLDRDDYHDDPWYEAEINELLRIISMASGIEPFISPSPPKLINDKEVNAIMAHGRQSMIAQVLIEQLTQSSVFKSYDGLQLPRTRSSPSFDAFIENVHTGTNANNATLGDLMTVQLAGGIGKVATRSVFLEPDRLRLIQGESEISAESSIIKYWETLNLQPLSGPKNVQALCLHPGGSNYSQGCDLLMKRMNETYTSCNLGTHQRVRLKDLTDSGLLAWDYKPDNLTLASLCRNVGKALTSQPGNGCTVVYVVMPKDDLCESVEICDAFLELFESLDRASHAPDDDIILQLLPSSFVVDASNLVIRPQKQYFDLALEVYNRTPGLKSSSASVTAGAALLERSTSRSPHFELSNSMSWPALRSGHCYHLAYCTSTDRKWLVASWSDAVGNTALTMPYCLQSEGSGLRRPHIDVLRHLCETSVHLMGTQRGLSWLTIAKLGIYEADELQDWTNLAQQLSNEHKSISQIVILNVELQSRLSLHGAHAFFKSTNGTMQTTTNVLSTPVTTPQPIITSPEQILTATPTTSMAASAQTPPDLSTDPGTEADAYLNDPLSEAWAITLAFGLNQTHNYLEVRPAMTSGLLLKRTIQQEGGAGLSLLNVNLIAVSRRGGAAVAPAEREQLLQDVLTQYRGLHILAVARRCLDDTEACIPWHVATAYKGAKILERLM